MEGWISNFDYRIPNLICDIGQCVTATSCNRVETGYESLLFAGLEVLDRMWRGFA